MGGLLINVDSSLSQSGLIAIEFLALADLFIMERIGGCSSLFGSSVKERSIGLDGVAINFVTSSCTSSP